MYDNIIYTIYYVNRTIQRTFLAAFREAGLYITPDQGLIISALFHGHAKNQQDIARFTGKDKTTITRALDVLIKEGYINRDTDPEDRRANMITLTRKGIDLHNKMVVIYEKKKDEIFKGFSKEKLKTCQETLDRLISVTELKQ